MQVYKYQNVFFLHFTEEELTQAMDYIPWASYMFNRLDPTLTRHPGLHGVMRGIDASYQKYIRGMRHANTLLNTELEEIRACQNFRFCSSWRGMYVFAISAEWVTGCTNASTARVQDVARLLDRRMPNRSERLEGSMQSFVDICRIGITIRAETPTDPDYIIFLNNSLARTMFQITKDLGPYIKTIESWATTFSNHASSKPSVPWIMKRLGVSNNG